MSDALNECQFRAVSGGTANFVVGSAVTGFFTPAQCTNPLVVNGGTYFWRAESDDLTEHELFQGTYTVATSTVARTTVLQSSNSGLKVAFSAAPRVRLVAPSQLLLSAQFPSTNSSTGIAGKSAYDSAGALYICYANNQWAKFTGSTSFGTGFLQLNNGVDFILLTDGISMLILAA